MSSLPGGATITDELREGLHELYRGLHAAPELSMQEHRTAPVRRARSGGAAAVSEIRMPRSWLCRPRRQDGEKALSGGLLLEGGSA